VPYLKKIHDFKITFEKIEDLKIFKERKYFEDFDNLLINFGATK
jgi:hypothetical protein